MSADPKRLMAKYGAELEAKQDQELREDSRRPDPMEGHAALMIVSGAGEAIHAASQCRAAASCIDAKQAATLKAKAALCGVVLYFTEGDRGEPLFIASRWSLTRQMHSVDEVEDFLSRIGAQGA